MTHREHKRGSKGLAGPWSEKDIQRSFEKDAALREQRPAQPSTSVTPARCRTCGHWNSREAWLCADCGLPFVPRAA